MVCCESTSFSWWQAWGPENPFGVADNGQAVAFHYCDFFSAEHVGEFACAGCAERTVGIPGAPSSYTKHRHLCAAGEKDGFGRRIQPGTDRIKQGRGQVNAAYCESCAVRPEQCASPGENASASRWPGDFWREELAAPRYHIEASRLRCSSGLLCRL